MRTERQRIACSMAESKGERALALLEEAAVELDAVGFAGISGRARDAARAVKKMLKWAAPETTQETP